MAPSPGLGNGLQSLRVLLVTPGFPADESDDRCIPPLQLLLQGLARFRPDIRIEILALNYPDRRGNYRWSGFPVVATGGGTRPLLRRWPTFLRGWRAGRAVHRKQSLDLVHALWLTDAAFVGRRIARSLHLPMAATIMGQDARIHNRYLRRLPLQAMHLSAVSRRAAAEFETSTGLAVETVLPWGIDAPSAVPPWEVRTIDLLGVGALTENKDFGTWIDVVDRLRSRGLRLRSVLIGDGPGRRSLEAEVDRRGLTDTIEFRGWRSRSEVLQTMRQSRVLLHPARYESFGFVCSEALSRGMAVVSRPVGIAEMSERWSVVEGGAAMAEACAQFLGRRAPARPEIPVSLGDAVRAWASFYDRFRA